MTATHEQAARFAEYNIGREAAFNLLSARIMEHCDFTTGDFRWTEDPTIGDEGDWYDRASPLVEPSFGQAALRWILERLLERGDSIGVVAWPFVADARESVDHWTRRRGARAVFRERPEGVETLYVLEPGASPEAVQGVAGTGGGHYEVGIMTPAPGDLPPNGADVTDDLVDGWARRATHVLFRGPSYDGYAIWTAPGAEPPEFIPKPGVV